MPPRAHRQAHHLRLTSKERHKWQRQQQQRPLLRAVAVLDRVRPSDRRRDDRLWRRRNVRRWPGGAGRGWWWRWWRGLRGGDGLWREWAAAFIDAATAAVSSSAASVRRRRLRAAAAPHAAGERAAALRLPPPTATATAAAAVLSAAASAIPPPPAVRQQRAASPSPPSAVWRAASASSWVPALQPIFGWRRRLAAPPGDSFVWLGREYPSPSPPAASPSSPAAAAVAMGLAPLAAATAAAASPATHWRRRRRRRRMDARERRRPSTSTIGHPASVVAAGRPPSARLDARVGAAVEWRAAATTAAVQ